MNERIFVNMGNGGIEPTQLSSYGSCRVKAQTKDITWGLCCSYCSKDEQRHDVFFILI